MPQKSKRITHIPLEQRDPRTVRAVVLARMSDPNAKDVSMEGQVEECEAFIERMGWPKPTLGPFTDKASGYHRVERPALDEVERLIAKRAVDVVVVLNFERLARDLVRRYAAIYHAEKYGVEYRFAELKPDGKMPDTMESKIYLPVMEAFGMMSRQKIVDDTKRGKAQRVAMGYPSGGRGGPPYGFRKALEGDGYKYWAERQDEAKTLRFMFSWLVEMAEAQDPRASARGLVRELHRRGSVTREGKDWSGQTVGEKLRNPLYCGKGQLNRWQTVRELKTNEDTGETYDAAVVYARDAKDTTPIGADMLPTLVDPEIWDKVQKILDRGNPSAGRIGRDNSNHAEEDTLLHSGYIKCAVCGRSMVRYWRPPSPEHPQGVAYYRCSTNATQPDACQRHAIRAEIAHDFAFRAMARVLSDPEKIVALADGAEQKMERADYVVLKSTNDMEAMVELVEAIDQEIADTLAAIAALSKLPGQSTVVDGLRGKLLDLNANRDRAEMERVRLSPKRNKAEQRRQFLTMMFSERSTIFDIATRHGGGDGTPKLVIDEWIPVPYAARLLNIDITPEEAVMTDDTAVTADWLEQRVGVTNDVASSWPETPYRRLLLDSNTPGDTTSEYLYDEVRTDFVVYWLLARMPFQEMRRLLRDLDVAVLVKFPRTKEEQRTRGKTPPEERLDIQVGNLLISGRAVVQAASSAGSLDGRNVTKLAMPTISTPAAQRSG
jgi:DNA invertase Pin-like site-specific DNA recombinase